MNYIFPESRFTSNSIPRQIWAIASELFEVVKAAIVGDWKHAVVEAYDVIHATETLIRIIEKRKSVNVYNTYYDVLHKNEMRGYYNVETRNIIKK